MTICNAFWFYGYDQIYRDPYSETTNNEIAATSVITYLASRRNDEITGIANPYQYTLILFESLVQSELNDPNNRWNLGVWDSFVYCDEGQDSLCLYFSDGMYCDNGLFRSTAIQISCHYSNNKPALYDINEYEECVYSAKLYFPDLCSDGTNTKLLRDSNEIEKIKASSYISAAANRRNTLKYTQISRLHNIGLSITVSEIEDLIRITLSGPMNQYFGIGFGSNGMLNTYSIIVNGHDDANNIIFFEQLLDSHARGYTLSPSFVLEEHIKHSIDNTHQLTISRKLSSSVEIDQYWLFSCIDDYIDIIWSVGKTLKFERHIAFGQDRLKYETETDTDYDKRETVVNSGSDFKLKINWTSIFIILILGIVAFYIVKKYKQNIIDFTQNVTANFNTRNNANNSLSAGSRSQYGSAQDSQPLIENKL